MRSFVLATTWALSASVADAQGLSDQQVAAAIELGRAGIVPIAQVSNGDFRVSIDGPVGRIAGAASRAFQQYRPFDLNSVTNDMRTLTFHVSADRDLNARRSAGSIQHIVLQRRGATGLEGVIQPVREVSGGEAYFDRLPDGDFDVVIATSSGPRRYTVSLKDRANIDGRPAARPPVARADAPVALARTEPPPAPAPAGPPLTRTVVRLFVQGDSRHMADAIQMLHAELTAVKINATIVQRGQPYDYRIVFGEGERDAAAAIALDAAGEVVAVAVRSAFTEKGAAEGAARDLSKKLAALLR